MKRAIIAVWVSVMCMVPAVAFASQNLGQNIATWGFTQLYWLVLLVGIAVAITLAIRKSWMALISVLLVTGLLAYISKNPNILATWGQFFGSLLS